MINIVEEVELECNLRLPKGKIEWNIHIIGFVDDKIYCVNLTYIQTRNSVTKTIEQLVSSWYKLLHFCGGELETDRCVWYIINWEFHKEKPKMKFLNKKLHI